MRLVTMKFSASQTTAKVVDQLCAGLGLPRRDLNLNEGASLGPQDCLIAAFPVFSGRLPAFFKAWMDQIQGRDTPAVAVVVYGNRAYEDALLELSDAEIGGCLGISKDSVRQYLTRARRKALEIYRRTEGDTGDEKRQKIFSGRR